MEFSVDNLGNIYVINNDNQLKKLSPRGDSLAVFNDVRRYGKIGSIDVTNPLKILVYYRDFTTIIELDRFLNIINTIDLRAQNILQAKAVGLAYDNNVWVFDELDAQSQDELVTTEHCRTKQPISVSFSTAFLIRNRSSTVTASFICTIRQRGFISSTIMAR